MFQCGLANIVSQKLEVADSLNVACGREFLEVSLLQGYTYLREITPPSVPSNPALPVSIEGTPLFSKIKLVIGAIPSHWLG